ncbi:uncharacterized protein LOC135122148 isoform X2 [Zophobas morio]|uniref:uncharacterized protein LOC135122148 isoform X2 n=1 Tax=Zophobas morio TaxID=2755281 RepID=UPI0030836F32
MRMVEPYEVDKAEPGCVESDEYEFEVNPQATPRILDDRITLVDIKDIRMRLSISYALSQSCKLSVFEEMIDRTIDKYQLVPHTLATTGKVQMTRQEIAKVIGQLFLQTSLVNLVSNVLDTPDFFWEEPDHLERLYLAIRGYLEISRRCEVLNRRLQVVSEMMGILKDEQNQLHGEKLEWIVIWLIVAELIVGIVGIVVTLYLTPAAPRSQERDEVGVWLIF